MLVTGLSVGVEMHKNKAPVQVINSYVAGLTSLVTYGQAINSFKQLKGQEIYLPFEGSPIEEMTSFLAKQEGLVWKEDLKPIYSPFPASVQLLQQGKAKAVVLPEPFVSMLQDKEKLQDKENIFVSLDYRQEWDTQTNSTNGYPQVVTLVNPNWAKANHELITQFNQLLTEAIAEVRQNPAVVVEQTATNFSFPPKVLQNSLSRTSFAMLIDEALATSITHYYQTIGRPLDDNSFKSFFYSYP